jgi:hypothetical protein
MFAANAEKYGTMPRHSTVSAHYEPRQARHLGRRCLGTFIHHRHLALVLSDFAQVWDIFRKASAGNIYPMVRSSLSLSFATTREQQTTVI